MIIRETEQGFKSRLRRSAVRYAALWNGTKMLYPWKQIPCDGSGAVSTGKQRIGIL